MADSVYTADLFGSPADAGLLVLASDNSHSRNLDSALLSVPDSAPHPLLPLPKLAVAHDFVIEQHSPATRKAHRSDFPLLALWFSARGLNAAGRSAGHLRANEEEGSAVQINLRIYTPIRLGERRRPSYLQEEKDDDLRIFAYIPGY